jgi:hypothetical protein
MKVHTARISNNINKIKIYPKILMIQQTNMLAYKRIIWRVRNKRVTSPQKQNESPHKGGAHTNEQTKAHMRVTHSKWINKCSKAGRKPAQRQGTHMHTMKIAERKTKYKHAREGRQHSVNESKIKTTTTHIQNIKHPFCLHAQKNRWGPLRQNMGT